MVILLSSLGKLGERFGLGGGKRQATNRSLRAQTQRSINLPEVTQLKSAVSATNPCSSDQLT